MQPATPEDLQSILDELARTEQAARKLVEGLSDAQLNWQPREGAAWSMAQCLDHLARINTGYAAAQRGAVSAVSPAAFRRRGPIRPGWPSRQFIRTMEPPPRRRFSAPSKSAPASRINGEQALQSFLDSHDPVRTLVCESVDLDLNRIRYKNPFVPLVRFTVGAGLLIILAHDRRHLWQAEQVRDSLPSQIS
jgi:hypothetical protein